MVYRTDLPGDFKSRYETGLNDMLQLDFLFDRGWDPKSVQDWMWRRTKEDYGGLGTVSFLREIVSCFALSRGDDIGAVKEEVFGKQRPSTLDDRSRIVGQNLIRRVKDLQESAADSLDPRNWELRERLLPEDERTTLLAFACVDGIILRQDGISDGKSTL